MMRNYAELRFEAGAIRTRRPQNGPPLRVGNGTRTSRMRTSQTIGLAVLGFPAVILVGPSSSTDDNVPWHYYAMERVQKPGCDGDYLIQRSDRDHGCTGHDDEL